MSDMTVKQIVDQIYENMSNAIPELVLMLIALQEKNAEPPRNLPVQIGVVAQAADVLAQVADGLADDEYAEFPDIRAEILDASNNVKKSSGSIRAASNDLVQNADRRDAYGNVMEGTKMIGSCCIKLLAIVYGAFFKRAVELAAATKKMSEDIDPYMADEDPQAFADAVSATCTRAGELSARMRELAENEESPMRRREIMEAADEIDRRSDALIEKCNEYLADIGNEAKRAVFVEELNAFNAALDQQMKPVEVMKAEYEEQQAVQARAEEERAAAEAAAAEAAEAEAALAEMVPPPSSKLTPIDVSQGHLSKELFVEECYLQKDGFRDLVAAAEQGDAEETAACARALVERQKVLDAEAEEIAAAWDDERKTKDAKKARKEIQKAMPQVLVTAKAVLQDTENDQKRELLEKRFREVDSALDAYQGLVEAPPKKTAEELAAEAAAAEVKQAIAARVAASQCESVVVVDGAGKLASRYDTREGVPEAAAADANGQPYVAFMATAREAEEIMNAMQCAAAQEDTAALVRATSDLEAIHPFLVEDMKRAAAGIHDKDKRDEVLEKIRAYEDEVMPRLQRAVNRVLANPEDEEAQAELAEAIRAAQDAIDEIAALTNADALSEVEKARAANAALCELAQDANADASEVEKAVAETSAHTQRVIDELRERASYCDDPAEADRLNALADDLEAALTETLTAAQKARENPTPENIAALKAASAKLDKRLAGAAAVFSYDDAAADVKKAKRAAAALCELVQYADADPQEVERATADTADYTQRVIDELRARAAACEDPAEAARLNALADELEAARVEMLEAAQRARENPTPENIAALKAAAAKLDKRLDAAEDALTNADTLVDVKKAKRANAALCELAQDVNADPKEVERAMTETADYTQRVIDELRARAAACEDPAEAARLNALADELEAARAEMLEAARRANENPTPENIAALKAASSKLDKALNAAEAALSPDDASTQIKKAKRANAALCEIAQDVNADSRKFDKALDETADYTQRVINELRARAAACEDPAEAKRLNALADQLEAARAEMLEAAQRARENPTPENIAALKAASAKLDKCLEAADVALNPESAAALAMAMAAKEREMLKSVPAHVKKASRYDACECIAEVVEAKQKKQPYVEFVATAREAEKVLNEVQRAAAKRDKEALLQSISDFEGLNPHLVEDMKRAAAGLRDKARREEATEKIRAYEEEIVPRLQRAVDRVLANPEDEEAQAELAEAVKAAKTAINEIAALTNADVLSEAEKARAANAELCELAQQKDVDACKFADAAAKVAAHTQSVIDELRAQAAACKDPAEAKRLNALANQLEADLAEMLKAAQRARENPTPENIAALKAASAKLDKTLATSQMALNPSDASKRGAALRRLDAQEVAMREATAELASARRLMMANASLIEKDPEAYKKGMAEIAARLETAAENINLSAEEQLAQDALRLAEKYQELANAGCDGDRTGVQTCVQLIAEDRDKLIEEAKTLAAMTANPVTKKELETAVAQLEELGDRPERAAQAAIADRSKAAEAQEEAQAAQAVLRAIADAANPYPIETIAREEKRFAAARADLRAAAEVGDAEAARTAALEMQRASDAIAAAASQIAASRVSNGLKPEEAKAVQEKARKLRVDAAEAASAAAKWAKDPANEQICEAMVGHADAAAQDVAEISGLLKVKPHHAAAQEREDLAKMQNAVVAHRNAPETFEAAKLVVADQKALREAVSEAKVDPATKRQMEGALAHIDRTIPMIVQDAKRALAEPCMANDAKVANEVYDAQTAVMAIDAALDANTPIGTAKRAIVDARKAITRAERAALAKNKREEEAAAQDMAKALELLKKLREDQKSALNAPGVDTEAVAKSLKEIEALTKDLEKLVKDKATENSAEVHSVAIRMKAPVAALEEAICVPRSQAAATKKKVAGISIRARKAAASGKRTDLSSLLAAAQSLLDGLLGFEAASRDAAYTGDNTERGKAALALDELLRGIEAGLIEVNAETTKKLNKLMSQAGSVKQAAPVPEKQSFAASIDAAASQVHEACQQHQDLGIDPTPLADLLRRLAEAAKRNDRQDMLICARSIAAYINNFSKESNAIIKSCKKEFVQDKIQRGSMALKNFGTQLKVLIAVKAASEKGDSDADDQIVSVVRSIARSLAEALDGMDMASRLK